MPLWRLHYHLVWATKERQPFITPQREANLYRYVRGKVTTLGCVLHAIGGLPDHVHLVVSIPPTLAIASFVANIKGSSAHHLNQDQSGHPFAWQRGYGVFSLGGKQVERAVSYVENQKVHHRDGTILAPYEQDGSDYDALSPLQRG